jgi:hypothetical protein
MIIVARITTPLVFVIEHVFTGWEKENGDIERQAIDSDSEKGKVMKEESLSSGRKPAVMEY